MCLTLNKIRAQRLRVDTLAIKSEMSNDFNTLSDTHARTVFSFEGPSRRREKTDVRTYISGQWAFLFMVILYVLVVPAGMNSWES